MREYHFDFSTFRYFLNGRFRHWIERSWFTLGSNCSSEKRYLIEPVVTYLALHHKHNEISVKTAIIAPQHSYESHIQ